MAILHLIRHGQTNWNAERRVQGQSESELDETGRSQARQRSDTIDALDIHAIYSSTSVRTRQTTDLLTQNLSLPVTYLDSLREIYLGNWETLLWDEIHASEPDAARQFFTEPHEFKKTGAESYTELRDRGVSALEHIIASEPDANVLVVSHGALLKAAMSHYAGVDLRRINDIPGLSNCSHSILQTGPGQERKLISIDEVAFEETEWAAN